jgi:hypothetical protein
VRPDLPAATWRKSSRYCGDNGSCVEVADLGEECGVRDSKNKEGAVLAFSRAQFGAFVASVKDASGFDRLG